MASIAIAYGSGGHAEQAARFLRRLDCDEGDLLIFKESGARNVCAAAGTLVELPQARPKHGPPVLRDWLRMIVRWGRVVKAVIRIRPAGLITFGPGMCVPLAIIFRLLGIKVVHIETWCRFNTRSMTGRLMYYLSNRFYVQNKSLVRVYPKSIYAGRL